MAQNGFIAGEYTCTYDGVTLGETESGFTLEVTYEYEQIIADNLGGSIQDGVYRGGQAYISATVMEPDKAAVLEAFTPHIGSAGVTDLGKIRESGNPIGKLATSFSKALVLTVVANTPASGAGGIATVTASKACLAPNMPLSALFTTNSRRIPFRFQLYPFTDTGVEYWFKVTANS